MIRLKSKKKPMKLILIMYFILLNNQNIISTCNNIKIINEIFTSLFMLNLLNLVYFTFTTHLNLE